MKREFEKAFSTPFRSDRIGSWVYDSKDNFIFQFITPNQQRKLEIMKSINSDYKSDMFGSITHEKGVIKSDNDDIILIRGWGYLTGTGGLNLPDIEAIKIQDDLANYLVEKLRR